MSQPRPPEPPGVLDAYLNSFLLPTREQRAEQAKAEARYGLDLYETLLAYPA